MGYYTDYNVTVSGFETTSPYEFLYAAKEQIV